MFHSSTEPRVCRKVSGLGIWSFDLFDLLIFSIFKKVDCDRMYLNDLWKRSTVIKLISLFFEKDQPWSNRSCRSLKKIDLDQNDHTDLWKRSIQSFSRSNRSFNHKKLLIWSKKNMFFISFWQFFPYLMPKDWIAPVDLQSFLKSARID